MTKAALAGPALEATPGARCAHRRTVAVCLHPRPGRRAPAESTRTPLNLALVLDWSGSMGAGKLEHAKEAAELSDLASRLEEERFVGEDVKYMKQRAYDAMRSKVMASDRYRRG
jgi:hypothetical protein